KNRTKNPAKAEQYERQALMAEVKLMTKSADAAIEQAVKELGATTDTKWLEANSYLSGISSKISTHPRQDSELTNLKTEAEKQSGFILTVIAGLRNERLGQRTQARDQFKRAELQIAVVPLAEAFVKAHLAKLGIDDDANRKVMASAMQSLQKTHPDDDSHPELAKAI